MNLPNKLTTFRVILIPFFVFFMLAPNMTGINHYIAAAIFIVASLTDLLDVKLQESTILSQTLESLWIRLQTSFWCVLR